jgi:hypothetical protein
MKRVIVLLFLILAVGSYVTAAWANFYNEGEVEYYIQTTKLDSDGQGLWSDERLFYLAHVPETDGYYFGVLSVGADLNGNTFVLAANGGGGNPMLLRYTPDGRFEHLEDLQLSTARYMFVRSTEADQVYVAGETDYEDHIGVQKVGEWIATYSAKPAVSTALAIDVDGGAALIGSVWHGDFSYGFLTVKFTDDGAFQWAKKYASTEMDTEPIDIVFDSQGDVIVVGIRWAERESVIVKYSADGEFLWDKHCQGPGMETYTTVTSVTVDAEDNVLVALDVEDGYDQILVQKYDPEGNLLWTTVLDGTGNYYARDSYLLATDAAGNVFATGSELAIKISPSGEQLWGINVPQSSNRPALDQEGNLIAGGLVGEYSDLKFYKLAPDGDALWCKRLSPIHGSYQWDTTIAVDFAGNVVLSVCDEVVLPDPSDDDSWTDDDTWADDDDNDIDDDIVDDVDFDAGGASGNIDDVANDGYIPCDNVDYNHSGDDSGDDDNGCGW